MSHYKGAYQRQNQNFAFVLDLHCSCRYYVLDSTSSIDTSFMILVLKKGVDIAGMRLTDEASTWHLRL